MTPAEQHSQLKKILQLAHDPVGVSGASDSESVTTGLVPAPSACSFWRRAETTRFTADAASHTNCKVGAHVMGFSLAGEDMQALGALVQTMTGVSYILPEEVPALPRLPEHKAWHYTPLSAAATTPELVLLWIDGRQVMLIQEAMGSAHWNSGKGLRTTGRPACGALALAYHHAETVLSFGCAGMRTFTEIPDGYMLLVVPGEALEGLCHGLEQTAKSNAAVQCVYDKQKASFA
ncbi:MAG: DUF169 domain-containing protein [Sulfuricaulis sp.]|uniref:DUF169 domain-containing protein n=1 Tax=Sulfuricaulis sp. TaxID=2003553 RepID=UPI0025DF469C|nr:DUF169 domain-containing protein [Sulfuricaulis sp.]MCR4346397.1 DUF169 domain-containing protein [Sulfuricaulis sp.]